MSIRLLTGIAASSGTKAQYKIANSLRIDSGEQLSRTPNSTGNTNKFTLSTWAKRSATGGMLYLGSYSDFSGTGWFDNIMFTSSDALDVLLANSSNSGMAARVTTSAVFKDYASWYHVVVSVDTTQATASDRIKIYVNGTQITDISSATYPTQNFNFANINVSGRTHYIGREAWSSPNYSSGYIAEYHHIDGQALTPSSFGEIDSTTGQWIPKQYSGAYGTNGIYLPFNYNVSRAALGIDPNRISDVRENATVSGSAVLSTAQSKFGGSSIYQPAATTSPVNFRTGTSAAQNYLFEGDFTVEGWVYPVSGADRSFYVSSDSSTYFALNYSMTANVFNLYLNSGGPTSPSFTFSNQWYHIALSRSGTGSNNLKLFVNGSLVWQTTNTSSLGYANPTLNRIGGGAGSDPQYVDDFRIYNGVGKYTTTFTPPTSALPIGTGDSNWSSVVLAVPADGSNNSTTIPTYYANYFNPIGVSVASGVENDVLLDSPTDYGQDTGLGGQVRGNYATCNPLDRSSYTPNGVGWTFTKGNLRIESNTSSDANSTGSTFVIPPNSGKWYYEATYTQISTGGSGFFWHYVKDSDNLNNNIGHCIAYGAANPWGSYGYYNSATGSGVATSAISNGAIFQVAIDSDTRKIYMGNNNTWYNSGNPSAGTNPIGTLAGTGPIILSFGARTGSTTQIIDFNFGQRPFAYTAPTNFKSLCTTNLPVPAVIKPSTYYDAVMYSGTSNSSTSVGGLNFSPDLVWIKNRTDYAEGSSNNMVFDVLRGVTNYLNTDNTGTQQTLATGLSSFNQTGFNPGTSTRTNESSKNYIAWCWDAGGSDLTNNDGTVTSTVRVNQTSGFSIVKYNTGNNQNAYTVGHGLGKVPKFIMIKGGYTTNTYNWDIYHASVGATKRLIINSTTAPETQGGPWDNTTPSSTLIYQNNQGNYWYGTNRDNIAYCWTDIPGYSKFASYNGTTTDDGPFIYLGFRPAWVLIKRTDTGGDYWNLMDSKRDTVNVTNATNRLYPNSINNDEVGNVTVDFLSNGFKIRDTNSNNNGNNMTYVYAAFAESPFKYARGR